MCLKYHSDVGALLLACTLPGVDLLAVNINYPSTYSALAVSSVLGHYGHPHVPIGLAGPYSNTTYLDDFYYEHGEYASKVAYHWRNQSTLPWKDVSGTWDPTDLYRHVLSQQPDKSVTIASIGFLNSVTRTLSLGPHGYVANLLSCLTYLIPRPMNTRLFPVQSLSLQKSVNW